MFQGAFNRAMGMATAGIMGAGKLLSQFGLPKPEKEDAAQEALTKQYQYALGRLIYKRDYNLKSRRAELEQMKARIEAESAKKRGGTK